MSVNIYTENGLKRIAGNGYGEKLMLNYPKRAKTQYRTRL